jgi:hypothetical protein
MFRIYGIVEGCGKKGDPQPFTAKNQAIRAMLPGFVSRYYSYKYVKFYNNNLYTIVS